MKRVSYGSLWRELALWLAALAVLVQATTLSAHFAHATAGLQHALLCSGESLPDDGAAPAKIACPICQVPQTGSLPPPNASGALPVAFDGCAIDFAVASTSEPQTLHLHPGQPRAPPGRNETI
jgi:hypothetical protein